MNRVINTSGYFNKYAEDAIIIPNMNRERYYDWFLMYQGFHFKPTTQFINICLP